MSAMKKKRRRRCACLVLQDWSTLATPASWTVSSNPCLTPENSGITSMVKFIAILIKSSYNLLCYCQRPLHVIVLRIIAGCVLVCLVHRWIDKAMTVITASISSGCIGCVCLLTWTQNRYQVAHRGKFNEDSATSTHFIFTSQNCFVSAVQAFRTYTRLPTSLDVMYVAKDLWTVNA